MWRDYRITVFIMLLMFISSALVAADEVKGVIINRAGDELTVKTGTGNVTVAVTANTKTQDDRGLLGVRQQEKSSDALIPGLKVTVQATQEQGRLVASEVFVDGDDLETSEMIQAGTYPITQRLDTQEKAIESAEQRLAQIEAALKAQGQKLNLNRLESSEVKNKATVTFSIGSSTISEPAQQELKRLAQSANTLPGYLIKVVGFADSTGDPAVNTKLSEERAKAVIAYLVQQCNVPVKRIVAPGAMGEQGAVASNETGAGRAQNRRVEVEVVAAKGAAPTQSANE